MSGYSQVFGHGVFNRSDVWSALDEIATRDDDGDYIADEGQLQHDVDLLLQLDDEWDGNHDTLYLESRFDSYLDSLIDEILIECHDVPEILVKHLDREAIRDELRQDYTVVECDGLTYYAV
jgi:hypothetical protein